MQEQDISRVKTDLKMKSLGKIECKKLCKVWYPEFRIIREDNKMGIY